MQNVFTFGPFRFDAADGLRRSDVEVPLPPRALAVLSALLAQPGIVVSKQALLDAAWPEAFVTEASLLEAVRLLRDALGDDWHQPTYIQTVHRRGYRFIALVKSLENQNPEHPRNPNSANPENRANPENPLRPHLTASLTAVASTIGVAMVFALFGQEPPKPRPTMRFTIALPADATLDPFRGSLAISADGMRVVYAAIHGGRPRLFLRTVDRDTPTLIEGSDEAADPFFSPDGQWIGFFAHGSLKKLRVEGGRAVVLCAARAGGGGSWGADGTIVFGGGPGGGLARISADGGEPGEPTVLATPQAGSRELRYGWPEILPDGSGVLYTVATLAGSSVALFDFESRARTTLVQAAAFGRASPTGHLIFERRGRLEAAPFSWKPPRLTAEPRPVLRGLATGTTWNGPRFAFSRTGSLVYIPGRSSAPDDRLHWLVSDGRLEPTPLPPAPIASVEVARDLTHLALTVDDETGPNVWVGDLTRGAISRLTVEGTSVNPTWRPDGLEIAFAYSKAGPFNIFVRPLVGEQNAAPLVESPWNQFPTSWSPDGRRIAFTEHHPLTGADVWVLDLATRTRQPFVRTLFDESDARFSPDGRWVAYMSNESGRWDVFVRPAAGGGPRVQVSTTGGAWPGWSLDGRTLYFSAAGQTAAAAMTDTATLTVGAPVIISGGRDLEPAGGLAGGGRVLVREAGASPDRRALRVVVEWFAELVRLVRMPA